MKVKNEPKFSGREKLVLLIISSLAVVVAAYYLYNAAFRPESDVIVTGEFMSEGAAADTESIGSEENETSAEPVANTQTALNIIPPDEFSYETKQEEDIHKGNLILIDSDHPYVGNTEDFVYLTDIRNHCYYISSNSFCLEKKAGAALNEITSAYVDNFQFPGLFIYNTNSSDTSQLPYCPDIIPERSSGLSIDFAIRNYDKSISQMDKTNGSWVYENAYKFGLVLRYPENKTSITNTEFIPYHFRYVGKINADIMYNNDYCLEEYIQFMKSYSYEDPYCYSDGNCDYELYYVPKGNETTNIPVPSNKDKHNYYISGNNIDGFIVIASV